ncbi:hypothetical protein CDFC105_73465 [Clostridioides difficile]|nr:hypothetical protein CDFC105_62450 [Clostridioides difficile]CZS10339.1 hypothetical protein CDFC105_73465 [Clostridioides difficile]
MAVQILNQYPLTDVVLVQIETVEQNPVTYTFDTSDEIGTEEILSEGEELTLKIKKKIIANRAAEDTSLGYDLTLKDNVFCPEILQIMQGGTIENEDDGSFKRYLAPEVGKTFSKKSFRTIIYSAVVGPGGDTGQFAKTIFPNCKGKSVPLNFKDGEYYSNEYVINSRPNTGQSPYEVEIVNELPSGYEATKVLLSSGSVAGAIAGNEEITGLTIGDIYKVTVDPSVTATIKYTLADGTLTTVEGDKAALTGTKITGLTNGTTYKVEKVESSI